MAAAEHALKSTRVRASLAQTALSRLDVVSRQEFDAQADLLARARTRVAELEAELRAMGEQIEKLGGQSTAV